MSITVSGAVPLASRRANPACGSGRTLSAAPGVAIAGILGVRATVCAEGGCRSDPGDYTSLRRLPLLSSGVAAAPTARPWAAHL